jgi:hypothetical protein
MATEPTTPGGKATKGLEDAIGSNFSPKAIAEVVVTLDNAASQMLKQFGQGQAMADILRMSMSESVTSVRKLGGDIEDVLKIQQEASKELGRNVILTEESTKDLYATMKVTGQEASKIVGGMADVGISSGKATAEMLKVVNVARESGVNAQAVSGKVLDNMQALNKYNFAGGVEGLAKMAAQATSLRIDMSQTLGFAEKVFNPEGAIEVAAAMQRLGVSQSSLLDPLKLMDLSQNDPAELQNQIAEMSKQFVQLGKDGHFEIMPGAKRQIREVEQAMGLASGTLAKMALGSADLDKKMKEISFPDVPEDQKKMIANMAEMGAGGEYKVKFTDAEGKQQEKSVSELSKDDVAALEKMANTAPPTMEELAKQQLSATEAVTAAINSLGDRTGLGLAGSKSGGQLLTGIRKVGTAIGDIPSEGLSSKNIAKEIDKFSDTVMGALTEYGNSGTGAGKLAEAFVDFAGFVKTELKDSFSNVKEQANKLTVELPFLSALINSGKVVAGGAPANTQIPTTTNNTTSSAGNSSGTQGSNSEVTHTLNVNFDSKNPNISAEQVKEAFNDSGVKQKMINVFNEIYSNPIGAPIPKKNEK